MCERGVPPLSVSAGTAPPGPAPGPLPSALPKVRLLGAFWLLGEQVGAGGRRGLVLPLVAAGSNCCLGDILPMPLVMLAALGAGAVDEAETSFPGGGGAGVKARESRFRRGMRGTRLEEWTMGAPSFTLRSVEKLLSFEPER